MNDITLLHGDCLALMQDIPDGSIDCIITDLPYSATQNHWDTIIPFDKLWSAYERIIKTNGAIILFAQGMFTADLMASNKKLWRYNLIWEKDRTTGFLNAASMPLRSHEDICVFYKNLPTYNPQFHEGKPLHGMGNKFKDGKLKNNNYGEFASEKNPSAERQGDTKKYPRSVLYFPKPHPPIHPTQKPVKLIEYLIRTYSNEGETILDNTAGSMTTAIAAINTNRKCICMEMDNENFRKGSERVRNHQKEVESIKNTSLFDFMV